MQTAKNWESQILHKRQCQTVMKATQTHAETQQATQTVQHWDVWQQDPLYSQRSTPSPHHSTSVRLLWSARQQQVARQLVHIPTAHTFTGNWQTTWWGGGCLLEATHTPGSECGGWGGKGAAKALPLASWRGDGRLRWLCTCDDDVVPERMKTWTQGSKNVVRHPGREEMPVFAGSVRICNDGDALPNWLMTLTQGSKNVMTDTVDKKCRLCWCGGILPGRGWWQWKVLGPLVVCSWSLRWWLWRCFSMPNHAPWWGDCRGRVQEGRRWCSLDNGDQCGCRLNHWSLYIHVEHRLGSHIGHSPKPETYLHRTKGLRICICQSPKPEPSFTYSVGLAATSLTQTWGTTHTKYGSGIHIWHSSKLKHCQQKKGWEATPEMPSQVIYSMGWEATPEMPSQVIYSMGWEATPKTPSQVMYSMGCHT